MSDLTLNGAAFAPAAVDPQTHSFNESLMKASQATPPWWETGAPKARAMRDAGQSAFPAPVFLPQAVTAHVPSRDPGRAIPVRVMPPAGGAAKGVFLHIHGGGWVLSHEGSQDPLLEWIANNLSVTVVSVGYRLAPEHPFPAGPNDCYDAGEYLVDNAVRLYDGPLLYMGGESAGGHLSAATCLHLLKARPKFSFKGLALSYGVYNLGTPLPSIKHFKLPLVLMPETVAHFVDAFTPGMTDAQRIDPAISPLYADLGRLLQETGHKTLPPAFFCVGTADCLQDDTLLMSTKWLASGSPAAVKIYPGAPHGFNVMNPQLSPSAAQWRLDFKSWVDKL